MTDTSPPASGDDPRGVLFALGAYGIWGFLPLYMKALAHVPAVEVVAHRVIWSLPLALLVLVLLGRTADLRRALMTPRMLGMAAMTAALISVNWGIYVWAIGVGRALDTALGYYINPLFSVALGALVLGERMTRWQLVALALAAAAVALLTLEAGGLPWVSLALTVTWGLYALLRKALPIGPNQGFTLEVLMLVPFALGCVAWLTATGRSHFTTAPDILLLLGTGLVTAGPLMLYANGAKLLRLSTIAMMQYIAPTMIFLIAVFVFDEPFGGAKPWAFALIWIGLALYTWGARRPTPVP